jgi:L-asparaginase
MRRQVLILNTGGTIGMRRTSDGYLPQPGFLQQQMAQIPELSDPEMPLYEVIEFEPVLDSANMTPDDWFNVADTLRLNYDRFDGFLILHGTDTMAYTASALAFMLRGLSKSVVLTGSQLPLCELRNDARENLLTAMILASRFTIPEVTIFFGSRLLRGCRSTKTTTALFDAFDSPNYPPLGIAGTELEVYQDRIRPRHSDANLRVFPMNPFRAASVRLFPGLDADVVRHLLDQPLDALLLQSYGVGNGPTNNADLMRVISSATVRGVVVVNLTQCQQGHVAMAEYATGNAMAGAGVVSGADMTFEAAVAKLQSLFSQRLSIDEIRRQIGVDQVGELTPSP